MPPAAPFHQLGSGWGWREGEIPDQHSPPDLHQGTPAPLRAARSFPPLASGLPKHVPCPLCPVIKLSVPFLPFGDNYQAPLKITPCSAHFNIYPLRTFACKYFIWQLLPACCCQKFSSLVKGLRLMGQPGVLVTCHVSPSASRRGSCSHSSWGASLVPLAGLSPTALPVFSTQAARRKAESIILEVPRNDIFVFQALPGSLSPALGKVPRVPRAALPELQVSGNNNLTMG